MVVLGQLASGVEVESLAVGQEMELVVEPLYETDGRGAHGLEVEARHEP